MEMRPKTTATLIHALCVPPSIFVIGIRRIAITELGMTYAGQGQIVEIPDDGSDYVRQYADIKK